MYKKFFKKSPSMFSLLALPIMGVVAFSLVVCAVMFTGMYKQSLINTATVNSLQMVEQVSKTVKIFNDDVQESVTLLSSKIDNANSVDETTDFLKSMMALKSEIVAIYIYDEDENLITYCVGDRQLREDISSKIPFDNTVFDGTSEIVISDPHVNNYFVGEYPWVVTAGRKEMSLQSGKNIYIAIDVKFSTLAYYVDTVGIGEHGYCYIANRSNDIIYHPQQQLIFSGLKNENTDILHKSAETFSNDTAIYAKTDVENMGWRIVGVNYVDDLIGNSVKNMTGAVLLVCLYAFVLTVVLVILHSRVVSRPITALCKAMNDFEKDAQKYKYSPTVGFKEIDVLSHSFDHLVVQIQSLMQKVRDEEIVIRKTELKALQAQINPHFLYNTLDSIQWMCEQGRSKEAVNMVGSLARLFRISINRGKEFVTIAQEIEHAKSYLIIQSIRYKNKFNYKFEVDETLLDYKCNKITLQPIIENAINHGIGDMVDEGELTITAFGRGNDVVFVVKDNGVGMSEDVRKGILLKNRKEGGIGLKNVNDRLKTYFGEQYGIEVESELDIGTTITITFPKIEEAQNENN